MKLFAVTLALSTLLPLTGHAAGNQRFHCSSKRAELAFHTVMHGELAIGEYTVLDGKRAELPNEGRPYDGSVTFYNQNRIFETRPIDETTLEFRVSAQLFGDHPTLLETGTCTEVD